MAGGYKQLINATIPPVEQGDFNKHRQDIYATLNTFAAPSLFGTATLASGQAIVSHPKCTASSNIIATAQDDNSTGSIRVIPIDGSFTIKSSNPSDHGVVAWWLWP